MDFCGKEGNVVLVGCGFKFSPELADGEVQPADFVVGVVHGYKVPSLVIDCKIYFDLF